MSKRTRHMNIKYFHVADRIKLGQVVVEYLKTENMIADTLTKPLQGTKFREFREKIMDSHSMRPDLLQGCVGKVVLENSNSDDGRENTSSGPMNEKLKRAVRPPEPGWGASQITQKSVESGVRPGVFPRLPNSLGYLGESVESSL